MFDSMQNILRKQAATGFWQALLYLLRLLLFWLVFFGVWRSAFMAFHRDKIPVGSGGEVLLCLAHGVRTDSATAGYLIAVPLLLWIAQQFARSNVISRISFVFNAVIIVALTIILAANVQLYTEWGTLINSRALWYFSRPAEVLNFLTWAEVGAISGAIIAFSGLFLLLFGAMRLVNIPFIEKKIGLKVIISPLLAVGVVVLMRGGLQQIPINESYAYFSMTAFLNHAAVNPVWHLGRMYGQSYTPADNPFLFSDVGEAEAALRRNALLGSSAAASPAMLTTSRPNVVIIILESWTADAVESCGGLSGITPFFDSLRRGGLLFSNCYGSGMRTDQGVPAILSGFPALPNASVMMLLDKMEKLPSLPAVFASKGYATSFYYGGESEFANMKSYFCIAG